MLRVVVQELEGILQVNHVEEPNDVEKDQEEKESGKENRMSRHNGPRNGLDGNPIH